MPAEAETALAELPPRQLTVKERLVSNLVQAPLFFSATAAFGTVSLLASLTEKDGRRQHRIARTWARCSLSIAGSPIHVTGLDVIHNHPVAVYACNHLSYMDTPAVFAAPFAGPLFFTPNSVARIARTSGAAVSAPKPPDSLVSATT